MKFIETLIFTKRITKLLDDDDLRALESALIARPDARADLGSGLRKIRWSVPGKGKRGGVRVIYYWVEPNDFILFLFAFKKNEQGDLTPTQEKQLRAFVKENFK